MRALILYILADAASKEVELKAAEAERDGLQEVIGQQEVKAIDAQRIAGDRNRLLDDLKRTTSDKEQLQACVCVCVCTYRKRLRTRSL